ncbi:DegT/DnrJ/EryC1/StrS family aminotransferase [Chryseolinea lacunae]|uniref:DegT/DnrJ/EryC1/StrS family aminotransferase n=1 Tax=Chryseolinea lacunae TaxID=2801331 RepID=A0ABS1KPI7_9BACT|nr:DegT/DnrJ/EryC1/StrS family aminotransferase [Chryseolinea lacunae]MBL0741345.1 DegT/DnrJ/EryC1/StrS family aminotransferase [Chryseolinea lacunae]
MIPVTKPFLPPIQEYEQYLQDIWKRNWLTNNGPLVNELELKLKDYQEVKHLLYVTNGTIAIQLAIKALGLKGEIITTPFSYVATTSSIVWEGCTPVFVDIDPATCNIDPAKIEAAITPQTSAILATHVYGNPCDVEAIDEIAKRRNLKVIYDGAHAFGVKYKGRSIFDYGDVSTCSFHATKLFHTIEGGSVVTKDPELLKRMAYLRNFGHDGPERFAELGINGKNSEFHAAMGLVNLRYVDRIIETRKQLSAHYDKFMGTFQGSKPSVSADVVYNYAYYPVIFDSEKLLVRVLDTLQQNWVHPRRYFFPSLENLPYVEKRGVCTVANSIAQRALCLPLYDTLSPEEIDMIFRIILRVQNN